MTTFGIDISHHQRGINLESATRNGQIQFVIAKMTEGKGWSDPLVGTYWADSKRLGLLFSVYHWVRGDSPASEQVANIAKHLPDPEIPVMLDVERTTGSGASPSWADVKAVASALRFKGLKVGLLYLPQWYWVEIGRPNMAGFALFQSAYGSNNGIYPGDASSRWSYGGGHGVEVLQFTSNGRVNGYDGAIDIDAYRGTREQLVQEGWFKDYRAKEETVPAPTKAEIQKWVAETPIIINEAGQRHQLQRILRDILAAANKEPSAAEIAAAVKAVLPPSAASSVAVTDIEKAVANVLRKGTDEVPKT